MIKKMHEGEMLDAVLRNADCFKCFECGEALVDVYEAGIPFGVLMAEEGRMSSRDEPSEPSSMYFVCFQCFQSEYVG